MSGATPKREPWRRPTPCQVAHQRFKVSFSTTSIPPRCFMFMCGTAIESSHCSIEERPPPLLPKMKNHSIAFVADSQDKRQVRRRLTRRINVKPARIFVPQHPGETPEHHFPQQAVYRIQNPGPRFVNRYDSKEILMVLHLQGRRRRRRARESDDDTFPYMNDGSCRDVGGIITFRLEDKGPGGEAVDPTSNRAKMRAVIAALEFRAWADEGVAVHRRRHGPRVRRARRHRVAAALGAAPVAEEPGPRPRRQPRLVGGDAGHHRPAARERHRGRLLVHPPAREAPRKRKAAYREPEICTEEFTRFCEIDMELW
ncbi:RNase H domain protein [Apiospora phragmitis]|uniref:RNase H domain protein n=1 Tax=Apiospora phragmitis TaxID=2905665 RepID=A0ABR1VF05_9PEZI